MRRANRPVLGLTLGVVAAILPADCPVTRHVLNPSTVTSRIRTGDESRRRRLRIPVSFGCAVEFAWDLDGIGARIT